MMNQQRTATHHPLMASLKDWNHLHHVKVLDFSWLICLNDLNFLETYKGLAFTNNMTWHE
jgi:hypothetical protein